MKRGKPLKRSTPLGGGKPLRADPEKVREFLDRGRQGLAHAALRRTPGFRRYTEAEGPLTPAEWRREVWVLSGGVCIVSGARARDADDPRYEAHHILPKRVLRSRGLYAFVWDPRNAAWMTKGAHARQEGAFDRLPWTRLPVGVWAFCRELDELAGTQWATDQVRRLHPASGSRRVSR